jgi:ParB/RepB/Spo0J family partition protein
MQTILAILKRAGGWHPGLYLKIDNAPYMELVIEAMDESGPMGLPALSVAHYGEQNGDLMRDPEMCFELGLAGGPHLDPWYWRNDYVAVEQWSRNVVRNHYVFPLSCMSSTSALPRRGTTTCACRDSLKSSTRTSTYAASPEFPANGADTGQRVRSTTTMQCNRSKGAITMNTTIVNATEYRDLPLAMFTESTTNPRRIFEGNALKELAESIRIQGVLSPLLVRPLNEQGFEIVAGARRCRAAQMAEAATVPVRIVHLTDAETLEAQLVENLMRRDVHPMEEAQGFRALLSLEEPKYRIEQIAARTGKNPSYIAARLKLTELAPVVVEGFYREEIGVGHALLLAKLQLDQQEQALAACFKEDWSAGGQKAKRILLPRPQSSVLD